MATTDSIVLNVDDDPIARSALTDFLSREGFHVLEAATGRDALSIAAESPDIVLLDVQLPDVDGFEVCRRLRADPRTAAIPVVQISGQFVGDEDQTRGRQSGADLYLTKPVEPELLLAQTRALVAEAALARAREVQRRLELERDGLRQRRKLLEDELRQSQKMEAVGYLAGGIAHDFNNLLTIINGYSDLLRRRLPPGGGWREMVAEIGAAGERAAALTRQLLAFSRRQVLAPQFLDLNALVADLEKLLRRLLGEDVELVTRLAPGLDGVHADPGQLEQVLLNLAVNARDAMPRGGRLALETRHVGPYVELVVSDTGCGMSEEVRTRIFEPFFSTKGERGTGLGLATVHGIVQQSGGHIRVHSEPGVGTTFRVYLPRRNGPAPATPSPPRPTDVPRGTETVLLVEDEPAVLSLGRQILQSCGYHVLAADRAGEALRAAGAHRGPLHLLVTDVVLPETGGPELARRVAALHPGMRVLYMSGYTNDAVVQHGVRENEVAFLHKPFSVGALARKVREVLDRGTAVPGHGPRPS